MTVLGMGLFFASVPALAETAADFARVNGALGVPLFADGALWDDPAAEVGKRLGWPAESEGTESLSHRIYTAPEARVCGARPFSMAFYGREGRPTMVSAIFANKGDIVFEYLRANPTDIPRTMREQQRLFEGIERKIGGTFRDAMKRDEAAIAGALTALFGPPQRESAGQSRELRARVSRWDWNGHAFLLSAPREEYVALKILPPATADATRPERHGTREMEKTFASRVEKRPNGDVVINGIPMVDQGPKGFCVPATWERYLRFLGIEADMYELAMAGKTGFGGGTFPAAMRESIDGLVAAAGCRLKSAGRRPDVRSVAPFIDRGIPLMWEMSVERELDKVLLHRAAQRKETPDPKIWKEVLKPLRKAARDIEPEKEMGHMCMVIGYNPATAELAISDSWGTEYAERWITEEEAAALALGDLTAITP